MIALAVLLLAAGVAFAVARLTGLHAIPLLLLAGLGLSAFGRLPDPDLLEMILVFGLAFLVFVMGIELNPRRIGRQRRAALRVGLFQFFGIGSAGIGASLFLGFDLMTALYLGLALSASSTLVAVRLLQTRRQLFEPFGRTVIGVLLLQDLLIILLIPVVGRLPDGGGAVLIGTGSALALTGLAFVCLRWVMPRLVRVLGDDEEGLLLAVLAVLFVFVGLATVLDLPLVAGAFLAGISVSTFPVSGVIRGLLNSLSDFFLAIFFVALGALVTIPSAEYLWRALALAALVLLLTPPLVTLVGERSGLSARSAIESGLLLAQTSEFSLLVALQGMILGHITGDVFSVVALVTVATMILTPFMATDGVTWWLVHRHPLRRPDTLPERPEDHILLLGCGDNGMPLLETILSAGYEAVVVDDDPAIIERLDEGGIPAIRGDGSDFDVLEEAGARNARVIVSTMRRVRDSETVVRNTPDIPVLVRVFDPEEAQRIRRLGGIPVDYAEAAADDLLRWLAQAEEVGLPRERRQRPRS